MRIKFNDLYFTNKKIENDLVKSFIKSIQKSKFIGGSEVLKFENNFKKLNNSKFCISCANGSDALVIAMKSLNINYGDEVIVTAFSWIASSAAITMVGGKIVFCDIQKDGFNIDPSLIEKKITKKTKGIIAVHLYGYPADMQKIMKIAKRYKIWVIEDCAQAHLAEINNKKVGNFGSFGTFSFFPGKNLGALGDAGCLVTNNKILAKKAKLIANHGGKGIHLLEGFNSRLDSIQAKFLNIKLRNIKRETNQRIKNAKIYDSLLNNIPDIKIPTTENKYKFVYHQYTIRVKKRNNLKKFLENNNIETQINYKQALTQMKAYKSYGLKNKDFAMSIQATKEILCLPISPDKTKSKIKFIVKIIKKFLKI